VDCHPPISFDCQADSFSYLPFYAQARAQSATALGNMPLKRRTGRVASREKTFPA